VTLEHLSHARLLTPNEAAAIARVSPGCLRRWVRERRLEAVRLGDGKQARIRIPAESLARFLRDGSVS